MQKVLITGGAGFVGKWVVEKLPAGTEIVIVDSLDRQAHRNGSGFDPMLKKRAVCIKADICNVSSYRKMINGCDTVIHLASKTSSSQSMYQHTEYMMHNVKGTEKLLKALDIAGTNIKRIILASSRAVYGEGAFENGSEIFYPKRRFLKNLRKGLWDIYDRHGNKLNPLPAKEEHRTYPVSFYGTTKLLQENLVSAYAAKRGIDSVIFRFQNIYGPRQELRNPYTGVINIFTNAILKQQEVELFEDGRMGRDFVYVEDAARMIVEAVNYDDRLSEIINFGSGKTVTLFGLVRSISNISVKEPSINISGRYCIGDIRYASADMSKCQTIFGKRPPVMLEEGLKSYLEWFMKQSFSADEELSKYMNEIRKKGVLRKNKCQK